MGLFLFWVRRTAWLTQLSSFCLPRHTAPCIAHGCLCVSEDGSATMGSSWGVRMSDDERPGRPHYSKSPDWTSECFSTSSSAVFRTNTVDYFVSGLVLLIMYICSGWTARLANVGSRDRRCIRRRTLQQVRV